MFREEIIYNWVQFLKLLIKQYFSLTGEIYDDENLFQQPIPDTLWCNLRNFVISLRELPMWKDGSMASTVFGGKQTYDYWMTIFRTANTPDGRQVLAKPLDTIEMIKR